MFFLGIELNTVKLEARLSQPKLDALVILLNKWLTKGYGKKRDLVSLHGKLDRMGVKSGATRKTFPEGYL